MPDQRSLTFEPANVPYQRTSHTSFKAACEIAASGTRQTKKRRYLQALNQAPEGLSDQHAAAVLGVPVQSMCSIRAGLMKNIPSLVERGEEMTGVWGKRVYRWRLTSAGRTLARAQEDGHVRT